MKQHNFPRFWRQRGWALGWLLSTLVFLLAGCGGRAVEPEPSDPPVAAPAREPASPPA